MDFETQKHSLYSSFFRFGISYRGKQTGFLSFSFHTSFILLPGQRPYGETNGTVPGRFLLLAVVIYSQHFSKQVNRVHFQGIGEHNKFFHAHPVFSRFYITKMPERNPFLCAKQFLASVINELFTAFVPASQSFSLLPASSIVRKKGS